MSILVIFFGGYKASKTDIELWRASAGKQRDDVQFQAFPYPDIPGAGDDDAVAGFKKQFGFDAVIKTIEGSGADTVFIVGHSSGCAIANELNSRIKEDKFHITLVDLDGFAPSPDKKRSQPLKPGLLTEIAARSIPCGGHRIKKYPTQSMPRTSIRFISPWSTKLRPTTSQASL